MSRPLRLVALAVATLLASACQLGAPSTPAPDASPLAAASAAPTAAPYAATLLGPEEAYAKVQSGEIAMVVDVRSLASWETERVAHAVNVPWVDLEKGYQQLPKDRFILLYCT